MKKFAAMIAAVMALSLTACGNATENNSDEPANTETVSQADAVITDEESNGSEPELESESTAEIEITESEEPALDRTIAKPETEIINSNTLSLTSDLKNVDSIRIYSYEVSSESGGEVTKNLIFEDTVEYIESEEICFDVENILESETYEKDNAAIKTDYYAKGVKLCLSNDENEE